MSGGGRALGAMARANLGFWPTVLPRVRRELRRWEEAARRIGDDRLREIALAKIAEESFNTEVAATLATLVPGPHRDAAIDAIVPLQVMYDYLDGVSEEPADDPLANGRRLFSAFVASLALEADEQVDNYSLARDYDDGGYLAILVEACRKSFASLPMAATVAPVAREAALRCGEAQTRTHAIGALGVEQVSDWATEESEGTGLTWWEYTAGGTASILSVHALIAAAADSRITPAAGADLDRAYLYISAISTLLDSLVDYRRDLDDGSHSFIGYYADEDEMVAGIGRVIARAAAEARGIRHGAHHQMTAAGVAAYYLSAPTAAEPPGPAIRRRAADELGPLLPAALGVFRLWRLKRNRAAEVSRLPAASIAKTRKLWRPGGTR